MYCVLSSHFGELAHALQLLLLVVSPCVMHSLPLPQVVASDSALLSLATGLHHHQVRQIILTATITAIQVVAPPNAPPPAEEHQAPDSAIDTQDSQLGGVTMDTITDETWDRSALPATEVGVWDTTESRAPYSSWNVKLLTEEKTAVVNAHFSPLLAGHWMVWHSPPPNSANSHLSMLSCGVCPRADLPDLVSSARASLFHVPFSCLLSLYHPGGSTAVQVTLLRAFPLQ